MTTILRQISVKLVNGNEKVDNVAERVWVMQDVEARYKLVQSVGKVQGGTILALAGQSYTLSLPYNYDNTKILWVMISAWGFMRVQVTMTNTVVHKFTIYGTSSVEGVIALGDNVSEVKVFNTGSGAVDANVDYVMFEQPDVGDSESYEGRWVTYGEATSDG